MTKKTNDRTSYSLRSFAKFCAPYWRRLSLVGVIFIVSNLLLGVVPLFIGRLVDTLSGANPSDAWVYVWILVLCSSIHDITWRFSEFSFRKYANPLGFLYENALFKKTMEMPYPYFVDKFTGKVSSYITSISQEYRQLLSELFFNYLGQFVTIAIFTIVLSTINWQTAAVFLVCMTGMVLVGRVTLQRATDSEKIATDTLSTKNGKLIDAIANFVSVKSFHKEHIEIATIKKEQAKSIKTANESFFWSIIFWTSVSIFIRHLMWPIVIILNVSLFLSGDISIGDLATILTTILIFTSTIWMLVWDVSQFSLRMARTEEAHRYLFGKTILETDRMTKEPASHRPFTSTITINNLSFAYPEQNDVSVLRDINLTITHGEKIGIVGRSGSGKTTLTKLLLGYYPLAPDTLHIDGEPATPHELAKLISYVPQDTSLFHRSVADNISYATDAIVDRDDIIRASKQAHADEFIQTLDGGYDALVGERGVRLSGGQRQRIAIARAFLKDAPLLILDEATSALDSESELLVQKALDDLWQHKTTIVIAHRLSTIAKLDRIIVLENGTIHEQGSHAELIEKKGLYAKLWSHQSGGFIEE